MVKTYVLYFCIDKYADIALKIMSGTLKEIYEFTTRFLDSKEIKNFYKSDIEKFMDRNKQYIDVIEKRTGKRETGDITIIKIDQNGNKIRKKVLYKKHIIVVKNIIINDYIDEFEIEKPTEISIKLEELDFKTIGRIYEFYKNNYQKYNLPSPNDIYKEYIRNSKDRSCETQQNFVQQELPICETPWEESEQMYQKLPIQQEDYGLPNTSIYDDPNPEPEGYEIHPHDQTESKKYAIKYLKY